MGFDFLRAKKPQAKACATNLAIQAIQVVRARVTFITQSKIFAESVLEHSF